MRRQLMSRLAGKVVALKRMTALSHRHRSVLPSTRKPTTVTVIHGPLADGAPAAGPYDVILIDGGAEIVPDLLCGQLTPGGRLVLL